MTELTAQSYLLKAEELFAEERNLQELFQNELFNRFAIGQKLYKIKQRKLYRFKDTDQSYTWEQWADEFMGSRNTANRFIDLWYVFEKHYKYLAQDLKVIPPSYLYEIVPLLTRGEEKPKEYVDDLLEKAKNAVSIKEFKKALIQEPYSIEELTVDGGHEHQWKAFHFKKCVICDKHETIKP